MLTSAGGQLRGPVGVLGQPDRIRLRQLARRLERRRLQQLVRDHPVRRHQPHVIHLRRRVHADLRRPVDRHHLLAAADVDEVEQRGHLAVRRGDPRRRDRHR